MPLIRRIPKRGFHNQWAAKWPSVNVGQLDAAVRRRRGSHARVAQDQRRAEGRYDVLKVLGDGELKQEAEDFGPSLQRKSALEKIQQAGGEAIVLPAPAPVVKNKMQAKVKQPLSASVIGLLSKRGN